jgi:glutamate racemase
LQEPGSLRTNRIVSEHPTILMFDSGLGGLTVFREVKAARPDARFNYVADDAFFPYGAHGEAELVGRVVPLMGTLIEQHQPVLIVIACNTASTLVLPHLRERYDVPFVGTVPAIKPACAASQTKRVSVLGTEGTVSREYTRALIRDFGNGADVTLVGSAKLAAIAEAELRGNAASDAAIAQEIAPCFVDEDGRRTDTIVLACTHFPLLLARLERLAPWPVGFIDPAPAIARRVVELIGPPAASAATSAEIAFTSGKPPSEALKATLARFGLASISR